MTEHCKNSRLNPYISPDKNKGCVGHTVFSGKSPAWNIPPGSVANSSPKAIFTVVSTLS
jgi:hypothetical protein